MNQNLHALNISLRTAISDDSLTSEMVLNEIKNTLNQLSTDLRVKASKARNVADAISSESSYSFVGIDDTIERPQEDDAYDPFKLYGAAQDVPYAYSSPGNDTISFTSSSLSSDTITLY